MIDAKQVEKYVEALNNILGADNAYFQGDKDVDTIVELIQTVKSINDERETILKDLQFRTNQVVEQQAEIERLKADNEQYEKITLLIANQRNYRDKEIEYLENAVEMLNCELDMAKDCIPEQRAEAIKECIEKLKDLSYESDLYDRNERWVRAVTIDELDEAYKEMVGEDK